MKVYVTCKDWPYDETSTRGPCCTSCHEDWEYGYESGGYFDNAPERSKKALVHVGGIACCVRIKPQTRDEWAWGIKAMRRRLRAEAEHVAPPRRG